MMFERRSWRGMLFAGAALAVVVLAGLASCWRAPDDAAEIVVYSALDEEFARPVLVDYTASTGVVVRGVYDVESSKTVGLVQRIIAEADRPRCDLFWNNEILHTIRLERQGLLEPYRSPVGAEYPAAFRAADGAWHGFAARARVLIVNTDRVPADQRPTSIHDLTQPRWKGQAAIARPLFGTTATHAACLFAAVGEPAAREFFERLAANDVRILAGNKQVAQRVASGELAWGLTDTDDALIEQRAGRPVTIVYPDQGPGELGTLFIPNTLAIVRGGPHPEAARRLVDQLLSPEVEGRLAASASGQIPLHPRVKTPAQVATPTTVRPMAVDFHRAAEAWEKSRAYLHQKFAARP